MAGEFFGLDFSQLASAGSQGPSVAESQKSQQSAILTSDNRDIKQLLSEAVNAMKETKDLLKLSSLDKESRDVVETTLTERRENVKVLLKNYMEEQGVPQGRAAKIATGIEERAYGEKLKDLDNTIDGVVKSFKDLRSGTNGLVQTFLTGGAGATAAVGLMRGSPIAFGAGMYAAGSQVRRRYKETQIEELEGQDVNPVVEALKESGIAVVAGIGAATNEVFNQAISRIESANEFFDSTAMAQRQGVTLQSADILGEGGRVNNLRMLSPQQLSMFTRMFGETGGGNNEEFRKSLDIFTRNTVLYGEAAVQMLKASRDLEMWVPEGNFSDIMENYTREMESKGIPPQLFQESFQALNALATDIGKRGADPEEIRKLFQTNQDIISTKLGMAGAYGVQGVRDLDSFTKSAISDPTKYAFLSEAGLSRREIFGIASGDLSIGSLSEEKLGGLVSHLQKRLASTPKEIQQYMLKNIFGDAGGELLYREMHPEERRQYQEQKNKVTADDITKNKKEISEVISGINQQDINKVLNGFNENMAGSAQAVLKFQAAGESLIQSASILAGTVNLIAKGTPGLNFLLDENRQRQGWGREIRGSILPQSVDVNKSTSGGEVGK